MQPNPNGKAGGEGAEAPPLSPNPMSKINPRLQLAWDATSLKALMLCPRFYQLTILEGWRGTSVHFDYGLLYHGALEVGDKVWALGGSLAEAQAASFDWALDNSGSYHVAEGLQGKEAKYWKPWGGRYEELWHCTHNPGPGKKKCEYAKAHQWFPQPAPTTCACGNPTETKWLYIPEHTAKNRETLLRAVVWYWEWIAEGGKTLATQMVPYVFPDGTVASELSFRLPLGMDAYTGEPFILCGHIDGLVVYGAEVFTRERKTTKMALSKRYFSGFSPDAQIDVYDLAGLLLYPSLGIKGVLLEACQALVGGCRFGRQMLYRSDAVREEFLRELLGYWLKQAERYALTGVYPMNRSACWNCDMREICAKDPASREKYLAADLERRPWNPLEVR